MWLTELFLGKPMDAFLSRNAGMMTLEEFTRYYELVGADPFLLFYLQILKDNFDEAVEDAVEQKIKTELPERVREEIEDILGTKLEKIRDETGRLEENMLKAVRNLSYDELPAQIEELFGAFDESLERLKEKEETKTDQ